MRSDADFDGEAFDIAAVNQELARLQKRITRPKPKAKPRRKRR